MPKTRSSKAESSKKSTAPRAPTAFQKAKSSARADLKKAKEQLRDATRNARSFGISSSRRR
jgi:hypothetical protein